MDLSCEMLVITSVSAAVLHFCTLVFQAAISNTMRYNRLLYLCHCGAMWRVECMKLHTFLMQVVCVHAIQAALYVQDLVMPGSHVDVNLHPTKREVGFLHKDELLEAIRAAFEETLLTSNGK